MENMTRAAVKRLLSCPIHLKELRYPDQFKKDLKRYLNESKKLNYEQAFMVEKSMLAPAIANRHNENFWNVEEDKKFLVNFGTNIGL